MCVSTHLLTCNFYSNTVVVCVCVPHSIRAVDNIVTNSKPLLILQHECVWEFAACHALSLLARLHLIHTICVCVCVCVCMCHASSLIARLHLTHAICVCVCVCVYVSRVIINSNAACNTRYLCDPSDTLYGPPITSLPSDTQYSPPITSLPSDTQYSPPITSLP